MRFLHVIANTDPRSGGPVQAVSTLSKALADLGHEVEIASLEPEKVASQRGLPVRIIGLGHGLGRHSVNPKLTSWLKRNAQNYDVVILHGLWNYASVGSWLALRGHATPYFIFSHGMMAQWFRKSFPAKHIVKQIYWWLIQGRVLRDAKAVLFTCDEERADARNVFLGHPYRECVVRYGTAEPQRDGERDKREFYAAFPELQNKPFLLCLCRIHPIKGCDLLLKAFAHCGQRLPADLNIMIAGPDQVGWMLQLRALAQELGIPDRVHWPGMLNGALKWGALCASDAMILPSHHENFGFVVAEAMAVSSPVLISDKVNIWREVEASGGGLVELDTEEGTANLMCRFYALSTEERARMAAAAHEGFRRYFDVRLAASDLTRAVGPQTRKFPEFEIGNG